MQFVGISAGIVTFFIASGTEALRLYSAARNEIRSRLRWLRSSLQCGR